MPVLTLRDDAPSARRTRVFLLTVVLALAVPVAGCLGVPPEDDDPPIRATAGAATLSEERRTSAGYESVHESRARLSVTIFVELGGDVSLTTKRRVNATVSTAAYRRTGDGQPSVFALYTAPGIQPFENAELTKNPFASLDEPTRFERAQSTYDDVGSLESTRTRTVTLLGNETTLTTYTATAARDGTSMDVTVAQATVFHRGDFVTALFVTPMGASQPVERLLEGVKYENTTLA